MQNADLLKQFTNSHLSGDWETYDALSTPDFILKGPAPDPLNKEAFLTWLKSVFEANDDLNNNVTVLESSGDIVKCTVQMEGNHTRAWDLSFLGLGVIPATNKAWKNPKEEMIVTIRDGKIAEIEVFVPEGGGIHGIFAQLGVGIPG